MGNDLVQTDMTFRVTNPTTGEFIHEVATLNAREREALLADVHEKQLRWRISNQGQRAAFTRALARALRKHKESLASLLTEEMGKPIKSARSEVEKCALLCDLAPDLALRALADEILVDDETALVKVRYDPLGVVLAVMPWNFPYWQALRFIIPALHAGNGVLLKPAASVAGGAKLLEQCMREASTEAETNSGAPAAPVFTAFIEHEDIADLIADDRIVGVTLTGSDRAGRAVAEVAGANLKKVVLELGGSDPFLVLPDANVEKAAETAVAARTVNSGQSCIAAKRFIVCSAVYDEFLERFASGMKALVVGDPRDEKTDVGPIATRSVWDDLAEQVQKSRDEGARAIVGGEKINGAGYFYPPTVLVDIPDSVAAANEELFGPVASVFRVANIEEAIARANDTPFGLGASVWTKNMSDADRCVESLEAGMVFVNDMVASDPRYPFGGVKNSGVGRELGAIGFREFTNQKTVRVAR